MFKATLRGEHEVAVKTMRLAKITESELDKASILFAWVEMWLALTDPRGATFPCHTQFKSELIIMAQGAADGAAQVPGESVKSGGMRRPRGADKR